jgi:hypothetical protein
MAMGGERDYRTTPMREAVGFGRRRRAANAAPDVELTK